MKKITQAGFTIIELLVFVTVLVIVAVIVITNIRSIRAEGRDESRKTDINALHYQLEALHEKTGFYPEELNETTLNGIDPESLKDTNGITIDQAGSDYIYTPNNCSEEKCGSYKLEATMEREADFVRESLNF